MSFPCTQCGLCCQNIGNVEMLREYHSGDGVCFHFQEELGCMIYENRPMACRVDEGYKVFFRSWMSREDYYHGNAEMCNKLQEAEGLPDAWRVRL